MPHYQNIYFNYGDALGVMVIIVGNGQGDRIQMDEAVCLSYSTNTPREDMNLYSPALVWQPVKKNQNSECKPVKIS